MSIFFDFDVGSSGRRFRRAVDGDKYDVEYFRNKEEINSIFGDKDVGSLIELSTLSICQINVHKRVQGFLCLNDHPNIPAVAAEDWEMWMRNMYQRFYLSSNTLFVHFMSCTDVAKDYFLEESLTSVFMNDSYLNQIVFTIPNGGVTVFRKRYRTLKRHVLCKYEDKRNDSKDTSHELYVALRKDFVPKLQIRRAVEQDNDDIVEILDAKAPSLAQMYGEYYISEIIGQNLGGKRTVLVAQQQNHESVVGVMCLKADIDYKKLERTYELRAFHGLRKATPYEKEDKKRKNDLLITFGDAILSGEWGPYDHISKLRDTSHKGLEQPPRTQPTKSKVNFDPLFSRKSTAIEGVNFTRRNWDSFYRPISPSHSQVTEMSNTASVYLLEDDTFDYDIVNIEPTLLSVPKVLSNYFVYHPAGVHTPKGRRSRFSFVSLRSNIRRFSYTAQQTKQDADSTSLKYSGGANAFMIELFGFRDDVDERHGIALLEVAFEVMKSYDYCIIRVPNRERAFPLLQHFCLVPIKTNICCRYALYIAHRSSVLGKIRVRAAELADIPQITILLQHYEARKTLWTIENSLCLKKPYKCYVLMTGVTIIGVGILDPTEDIDFLRAKYNFDTLHNHKYHYQNVGVGLGFAVLKAAVVYPVFETHYRFFIRDMLRLSGCQSLIWLTAYKSKMGPSKINSVISAMIPILPRIIEIDCVANVEHKPFCDLAMKSRPFCMWFLDNKLSSIPRVNVDTRIVVVGASRTGMAFLNALLFGDAASYLTFTSVTLISPNGLPYTKKGKQLAEMMFLKRRSTTDKYLKSVPYTYYVDIISSSVIEIDRKNRFVSLSNGGKCFYDLLFLLPGRQYQNPYYMKAIKSSEEKKCNDEAPLKYTRLDIPKVDYFDPELLFTSNMYVPDNVFIINTKNEAEKALSFVKNLYFFENTGKVIVYGRTHHAYCCLATLLEMKVKPENIIFVEPFPPEDPTKIRVPIFDNVYVDHTVNAYMKKLGLTTYTSYYFQSWHVSLENMVDCIDFISYFNTITLPCAALFYYGEKDISGQLLVACNKCGMAYDGGILIDNHFRTKDPNIYAAGPSTAYYRRFYADNLKHKYFDAFEVGEYLGNQIRNSLDPWFVDTTQLRKRSVRFSFKETTSSGGDPVPDTYNPRASRESQDRSYELMMPQFKYPVVKHCMLPGGLQYLDVRSPGLKTPPNYLQSLKYNGYVMETFKKGYFKIHMTRDFVVDGITCMTREDISLDNFKRLYGLSTEILNNVYVKYMSKKIEDFYDYFRMPWAFVLYHEHYGELLKMVQQIVPTSGSESLKTIIKSVADKYLVTKHRDSIKDEVRVNLSKTSHIETITNFVLEWVSENNVLLPMYMQPSDRTYYGYDIEKNPAFRRKKKLKKY